MFGSAVVEETVAVFAKVPSAVGVTLIVTVADPWKAMVPMVQLTLAFVPVHVP